MISNWHKFRGFVCWSLMIYLKNSFVFCIYLFIVFLSTFLAQRCKWDTDKSKAEREHNAINSNNHLHKTPGYLGSDDCFVRNRSSMNNWSWLFFFYRPAVSSSHPLGSDQIFLWQQRVWCVLFPALSCCMLLVSHLMWFYSSLVAAAGMTPTMLVFGGSLKDR